MKKSKEEVKKRQEEIIEYLRVHKEENVHRLAEKFQVTSTTIRRDLCILEKDGQISRSFGGARIQPQINTEQISPTNIWDEKEFIRKEIAKAAAEKIHDGEIVFMNSSATASLILAYLGDKNVTVITNNSRAVDIPRRSGTQLLLTGGNVYGKKESLVGEIACNTISKVTADVCILGVSGISVKAGITSQILEETRINRMMLERCTGERIIVAEGSKIGKSHSFYSGAIQDITCLITDTSASKEELDAIRKKRIAVEIIS